MTTSPPLRSSGPPTSRTSVVGVALVLVALSGSIAARMFADRRTIAVVAIVAVAGPAAAANRWSMRARAGLHVVSLFVGLALTAVISGGQLPGDVVDGLVSGVGDVLSVSWPAPVEPSLLVTAAFLIGLAAIVTVELVRADRWRAAVLIPSVVVALVTTAAAAPANRPSLPLVIAWVAVAGLLMFVIEARPERQGSRSMGAGALVAVVMVVPVTVVGLVGGHLLPTWTATERTDPRAGRKVTVDDLLGYQSLAGVAVERATDPPIPKFRVTGTTATTTTTTTTATQWRLFGLDQFNGIEWGIGSSFRQIGRRLGPPSVGGLANAAVDVTVEPLADPLSWLPISGVPLAVDGRAAADNDRSMLLLESPIEVGESVTATMGPTATVAEVPRVGLADPVDALAGDFRRSADVLRQLGASIGSSSNGPGSNGRASNGDSLVGALQAIELALQETYLLDPNSPVSSSAGALRAILESSKQGAEEQYVAAFTLMARSLGARSRVAIGYRTTTGASVLTSADARAWPEVWFDRAGWVAFDPVPRRLASGQPAPARPTGTQLPVVFPDVAVNAGDQPAVSQPGPEPVAAAQAARSISRWAIALTFLLIAIIGWVVILVATVVAKGRRRHRRLTAPDPADRVIGAWAEATDAFVDYGVSFPVSLTNEAIVAKAATMIDPDGVAAVTTLAGLANAAAFADDPPDELTVALASRLIAQVDDALRVHRPLAERCRARVTLRSLRRATRSPVR